MLRRFSIIALTALTCAGPLAAQTHSRIPTADDEKQLTAIFRQVDANHDSRISKVEMTSFGVAHRLGTIDELEVVKTLLDLERAKPGGMKACTMRLTWHA